MKQVIHSFRSKVVKEQIYNQLQKRFKIAKHTLIMPQSFERFKCSFNSAYEGLLLLIYLGYCREFSQFEEMRDLDIRIALAQTAYNHRYQGDWEIVQAVLEKPPSLEGVCNGLLLHLNENDIFGNLIPRIWKGFYRRVQREKVKKSPWEEKKVIRKVRKRGYDDKGSLRPEHLWLPKTGRPPLPPRTNRRDHIVLRSTKPNTEDPLAAGAYLSIHFPEGGN